MKFIYFGSSDFSKTVLECLFVQGYAPELVISKPDKPKGRGLKLTPTAVSLFTRSKDIRCMKPAFLGRSDLETVLRKLEPDFFLVADFGSRIPLNLLSVPRFFALCLHPSLLPRYRGAAPIEYALLNGDILTGVSVFKMSEHIDAGDILMQKTVAIDANDDFISLTGKLARLGAAVLIEAIAKVTTSQVTLIPQAEAEASLTHKLTKEDGRISWEESAGAIRNRIRATRGWPSAYTYYKSIRLQIIEVRALMDQSAPGAGTVVRADREGIFVATGKGILQILTLKPQGKRQMTAGAFILGHKLKAGDSLVSRKEES